MSVGFLNDNKTMQTIRARVAFHSRQHSFDKCMQQILAGRQSPIPATTIANLYAHWGDPLTSADESYLRSCLAEVNAARGAILLSGASLTTLLLGAACEKADEHDGKQIWCLEHDRHWSNTIRSWLTEYQVRKAHVIHSQARMFEDYTWYSVDTQRLAKSYSLIICEGARATPRGVLGALQRLNNKLDDGFVVLARGISQQADLRFLSSWASANNAKFVLFDKQEGMIKITRKAAAQMPPVAEIRSGQRALKTA